MHESPGAWVNGTALDPHWPCCHAGDAVTSVTSFAYQFSMQFPCSPVLRKWLSMLRPSFLAAVLLLLAWSLAPAFALSGTHRS